VPQDVFLFSDTVANNISFGIKDPNKMQEEKRQYRQVFTEKILGFDEK
jgi:ABC-type multidrug transport system fused ATPase/permease subunit